jgi:hypothetical protein
VIDMLQVILRLFEAITANPAAVDLLQHYTHHILVSSRQSAGVHSLLHLYSVTD